MIPIARPILSKTEEEAVIKVIRSGMIAMGEVVTELENRFARMFKYDHVIATSSGTTALQAALWAHDIGAGDEVITTPFSFIATATSILSVGAKPVFIDIDPETFNINPALVEAKVTRRTKAIMPVHLYGQLCDMDAIAQIARKHNLIIIEDACQSHGATFKKKYAGSWETAAFSLYPTKNMTSAEGGFVTTKRTRIAKRVRLFINHGQQERYKHTSFGLNFRMTNVHAAIGVEQVKKLKQFNQKRQKNAQYYLTHLQNITLPPTDPRCEHVYHQFTLRIAQNRPEIVEKLQKAEIGTGIHYPTPIHQQPYFRKLGYAAESYPEAQKASQEVLSIPVHPLLTKKDLHYICTTLNTLVSHSQ